MQKLKLQNSLSSKQRVLNTGAISYNGLILYNKSSISLKLCLDPKKLKWAQFSFLFMIHLFHSYSSN